MSLCVYLPNSCNRCITPPEPGVGNLRSQLAIRPLHSPFNIVEANLSGSKAYMWFAMQHLKQWQIESVAFCSDGKSAAMPVLSPTGFLLTS